MTEREHAFIRAVVSGKTTRDAYIEVYKPRPGIKDASVRSSASRIATKLSAEIAAARADIDAEARKAATITKEDAIKLLEVIAAGSLQDSPKVSIDAIKTLADFNGWNVPQVVDNRVSVAVDFDRRRLLRIAGAQEGRRK